MVDSSQETGVDDGAKVWCLIDDPANDVVVSNGCDLQREKSKLLVLLFMESDSDFWLFQVL